MAFQPVKELSSITKKPRYINTIDDEDEELVEAYKEILRVHKSKQASKNDVKSLEEKDKELNELRVTLKERKSPLQIGKI